MKVLTSLLALVIGAVIMLGVIEVGRADTPAPLRLAQVAEGSGSAVTIPPFEAPKDAPATETSTAKPSDTIHDPTTEPGASWDDVKAAKKTGWAAAIFVVLLMLARLAGKAKSTPWLAWLGRGRTAVLVGGVGAVAAGCYDAAVGGGSWVAIMTAAGIAFAAYWNSHPAEK